MSGVVLKSFDMLILVHLLLLKINHQEWLTQYVSSVVLGYDLDRRRPTARLGVTMKWPKKLSKEQRLNRLGEAVWNARFMFTVKWPRVHETIMLCFAKFTMQNCEIATKTHLIFLDEFVSLKETMLNVHRILKAEGAYEVKRLCIFRLRRVFLQVPFQ